MGLPLGRRVSPWPSSPLKSPEPQSGHVWLDTPGKAACERPSVGVFRASHAVSYEERRDAWLKWRNGIPVESWIAYERGEAVYCPGYKLVKGQPSPCRQRWGAADTYTSVAVRVWSREQSEREKRVNATVGEAPPRIRAASVVFTCRKCDNPIEFLFYYWGEPHGPKVASREPELGHFTNQRASVNFLF